eukprot:COSAG01_NODE_52826_length_343_cov_10.282787_1_plen_61_part_10
MLIASADYIVATASSTVSTVASHMFAARQVSLNMSWHRPLRLDTDTRATSPIFADEWAIE